MKAAIPTSAYRCPICRSRCRCHDRPHVECPEAKVRDCAGGCGRRTTRAESCHPGFWCRACAHQPGNAEAWRVAALIETEGGWWPTCSAAMSYSDARHLLAQLERDGARDVHLVESGGSRPRTRRRVTPPATSPGQRDLFNERKGE